MPTSRTEWAASTHAQKFCAVAFSHCRRGFGRDADPYPLTVPVALIFSNARRGQRPNRLLKQGVQEAAVILTN